MAKILKNNTGSAVILGDVGLTIPASGQITIQIQDYLLFAASVDVVTELTAGNLTLEVDGQDLVTANAVIHLALEASKIAINEFILKNEINGAGDVIFSAADQFGGFTIKKSTTSGFFSMMPNAATLQWLGADPNSANGVNQWFLDVDNQGVLYLNTLPGAGAGADVVATDGAALRPDNNGTSTLGTLAFQWGQVFGAAIMISANDTTPRRLIEKLVGSDSIDLTEQNDGGDETLQIESKLPEYQYVESEGTSSTTSSSFQQKLRLTTSSLVGGDYRIHYSGEVTNTSEERAVQARCQIDDTTEIGQHGASFGEDEPNEFYAFAGKKKIALTAGVHTIDIDFREQSGGTAEIRRARIELWRINT